MISFWEAFCRKLQKEMLPFVIDCRGICKLLYLRQVVKEVIIRMKKQIVVYLWDTEYGKRLVRYLNQVPEFAYQVVSFSEEEMLMNYLKKQKVCVLITQEQISLEPELYEQMEEVIYLVEHQQSVGQTCDQGHKKSIYFYQYQSMEKLLELLPPSQDQIKQEQRNNSRFEKRVIGIFMPEDVCHASSTARLIAEEIRAKEKAVYVSFVPFDQSEEAMLKAGEIQGTYGMSDFIYYLKEESEDLKRIVQQVVLKSRTLDYISPVNHSLDLLELGKEEVNQILWLLQEAGYTTIVVAISMLTQATVELLRQSKAILCLRSETMPQLWRDRIKQQLGQVLTKEFEDRYYEIDLCNEKELLTKLHRELKGILEA